MHIDPLVVGPIAGILGLISVDTLLGIAVAVKNHALTADSLPHELESSVIPVIGGLGIVGALQSVLSGTPATAVGALLIGRVALVIPKLGLDIVEKVSLLVGSPSA